MNPEKPPITPSQPATTSQPPQPVKKRRPWVLYIFGGMITLLLAVIAVFAFLLWWSQRPIKPTVLTEAERTTLEEKLHYLAPPPAAVDAPAEPDRIYLPGSNVVQLTEREINGLLNDNTELGSTVRLEFGRDAINAYIAAPIPEDVPLMGGKMFRARGRFRLALNSNEPPVAVLEDVTVYGVSMPKAWLGGLKGENLLKDVMGERDGQPLVKGIKSLRIQPGTLLLELED